MMMMIMIIITIAITTITTQCVTKQRKRRQRCRQKGWILPCLQYIISLLLASLCYFLSTRFMCFNILFIFVFCFVFLLSVLCILCRIVFLYCFVYCFSFCAASSLFLYKSNDRCHQVESQLQSINIIKTFSQLVLCVS